ncbi:MAG: hypothetical protein AAFW00_28565 [Bacteroidota bacterium]
MTTFLWIIGILVGLNITFRLFGRQIVSFGLKQLTRRFLKQAEEQSKAYQRNYEDTYGQTNVYVDDDVKVSAPKKPDNKHISEDEIAEDIDFEDVK